jgi:hypothetical protein
MRLYEIQNYPYRSCKVSLYMFAFVKITNTETEKIVNSFAYTNIEQNEILHIYGYVIGVFYRIQILLYYNHFKLANKEPG